MMVTNGRVLKCLSVNLVLFVNFISGTEIGTRTRFSKSTSPDSLDIRCVLDNCSLSQVIRLLKNQDVSFTCNLTTSYQNQENHALQLILVDVDKKFVLGDDLCRWHRRHGDEYLYCDLQIAQNFGNVGERHLAYLISPLDFYNNFTIVVVEANTNQITKCDGPLEKHSSTVQMITKRLTQPSVKLYSGDEVPESGPSLVGKIIVGGTGLVLIIVWLIIITRYCKEKRREEVTTQKEEATHMIVYKTQPTWCQDPETDSDVDEMEPFLSHDSDE